MHWLPPQKTLRSYPDCDEIYHEDNSVLVRWVKKEAAQCLGQPYEDPGDESPLDAAEPAKGHDAKGYSTEQAAYLRIDIVIGGEKRPGHTDQRRTDSERKRVDALGVDPHQQGRLTVHLRSE